ncbi:hypothetical protein YASMINEVIRUS_1057 [Yasminevirus sp. GU-2018]|uniref:Spore protein YkvP/CgeB glycosyl transferase-like domain-containing protein n=1 Tax=Yasminevirus sp. GU-2018 TaxID=2420051 RepID=A0A5K0UAT4_9VIRU|nr:hypothetical protein YASMINEVIRUS_1057 [Yasminevirus sp. GU-2018]
MRKLLIVCFYELKDYLVSISDSFSKKYRWDVVAYPLYMYCFDKYSKIDNYADHMSEFFKKEKPDVVLWWFADVSTSLITRIRNENPDPFYIIYNYSDPMNISKMFLDRCHIFDHVLTVCQHTLPIYKMQAKNKYVDFFPFGFDPDVFYQRTTSKELATLDRKYESDVSFICDSMFMDQPDQVIDRKKIIEQIYEYCKTNGLIFSVYGPDFLGHFAKDSYRGDVKYADIPAVATLSKINIVSHPDSRKKLGLCNPNLLPIMACGGVVLMDKINGAEMFFNENKKTVFMFDKDSLLSKMSDILNLYKNDTVLLNEIKQNAIKFSGQYNWGSFAEKIYLRYVQDRFDGEFYARVYNISADTKIERLQKIWYQSHTKGEFQIPFKFTVPTNFDIENYRLKTSLKEDTTSNEAVYIHWYVNGKDKDYIRRGGRKGQPGTNLISERSIGTTVAPGSGDGSPCELSGSSYNLPTTKLFELFSGFNMMYVSSNVEDGLKTIERVSKQNPRLKINEALDKYIDLSYNE